MQTYTTAKSDTTSINGKFLPEAAYRFKIMEQPVTTTSAAGNLMLPLKLETFGNENIETEQGERDINGLKLMVWPLLVDGKMSDIINLLAQAGVESFGLNEENVLVDGASGEPLDLEGVEFLALAESKNEPKKDADKNVLINPVTDEPFTVLRHNIKEIC